MKEMNESNNKKFFLSICIISYNRPEEIGRLLNSIDVQKYSEQLEIVVSEDCAPRRLEVRNTVRNFMAHSKYKVTYVENEENLGFSKNWRKAAHSASGEYLLYMGDDDIFVPNVLDNYIDWLYEHRNLGYVLRSYQTILGNGKIEINKYYRTDKFFDPGVKAYTNFFLKSNFMSGYTIKREYSYLFEDDSIDYTLYYQMYLMAEVCLRYPSGYCSIPITQYVGDGISFHGANVIEQSHYKQGTPPANNIHNVVKTFAVCELIDKLNGLNTTPILKKEFAKYSSFPTMAARREISISELKGAKKVLESYGLNTSSYFYLYYYALLILGSKCCYRIVRCIKRIYGSRPNL